MAHWVDKLNEIEARLKERETALTAECLPGIKLSEFERRDIAVEIYSEFLGCALWLCSNAKMAAQIRNDAPDAVTYTVSEIRQLISLNHSLEGLKKIHDAKIVFPDSVVKETTPREESHGALSSRGLGGDEINW